MISNTARYRVTAYGGRGDTRIAFERGELMINTQSTPAYLNSVVPLMDEGRVMLLYAIGFIDSDGNPVRDPAVPDMITAPELYEQIHGEMPSGTIWEAYKVTVPLVQNTHGTVWAHGDIPEEAMKALRIGVEGMLDDPEFQQAAGNILEGYPMARRGEAARALGAAFTTSLIGGLIGALALSDTLVALLWGLGVAMQLRWPTPLLL